MKRIFYAVLAVAFWGCGAKTTPAEPPVSIDEYLNSGWKNFATFRFSDARDDFSKVIDIDSRNLEAYYGYVLSAMSLGDYNNAALYANISAFLVDPSWVRGVTETRIITDEDVTQKCSTMVYRVDSALVTIIDTTVDPPETTYVYDYYMSGVFKYKVRDGDIINWNRMSATNVNTINVTASDGEYLYGHFQGSLWDYREADTLRCSLFRVGDTVELTYEYTTPTPIDSFGWNIMVAGAAANYYAENLYQAMKLINSSLYKPVEGSNIPDRVPVRYALDEVHMLMLMNYFKMQNWALLINTIKTYYDPDFPTTDWSLGNLEDFFYADSIVDIVTAKYYEILTQVQVSFKIKDGTKRR
ncbi:MAG: hypothetical protein GXO39_03815 [Thermotogae bacterium]|nr:hypothetical protein [Thermotogota bacterium]